MCYDFLGITILTTLKDHMLHSIFFFGLFCPPLGKACQFMALCLFLSLVSPSVLALKPSFP
jgi:hypothetical protein